MKELFKDKKWWGRRYDGRKKEFRGLSRERFNAMAAKHCARLRDKHRIKQKRFSKCRDMLNFFKEIPYKYEGGGLDDFNVFQRPCSNGIGYVAICPGERGEQCIC